MSAPAKLLGVCRRDIPHYISHSAPWNTNLHRLSHCFQFNRVQPIKKYLLNNNKAKREGDIKQSLLEVKCQVSQYEMCLLFWISEMHHIFLICFWTSMLSIALQCHSAERWSFCWSSELWGISAERFCLAKRLSSPSFLLIPVPLSRHPQSVLFALSGHQKPDSHVSSEAEPQRQRYLDSWRVIMW